MQLSGPWNISPGLISKDEPVLLMFEENEQDPAEGTVSSADPRVTVNGYWSRKGDAVSLGATVSITDPDMRSGVALDTQEFTVMGTLTRTENRLEGEMKVGEREGAAIRVFVIKGEPARLMDGSR